MSHDVTLARQTELLKAVPYFSDLSSSELAIVADHLNARHLEAGQLGFLEGDPNAGLTLVVSGQAKIYRTSTDGREQVLALLNPGDSCNEVPVVDDGPNPATLAAVQSTTVWVWTGADMDDLCRAIPTLNQAIIRNLAARCRELVERVYTLSFLSVTARLASFLLQQTSTQANLDRGRWTQEEIAAHIGTVREMVGRALRNLERDGLIRFNRHQIEIVDSDGLVSLL